MAQGVKIEEVARELRTAVSTSRLRYREFLEALLKVAQALPWGKDVTVKNVVKNAPFVMRYMEMKSMDKHALDGETSNYTEFDLREVISRCLRKEIGYYIKEDSAGYDDSRYFEVQNVIDLEKVRVMICICFSFHMSACLCYTNKFLEEAGCGNHTELIAKAQKRKSKRGVELHATDWWNVKTELSKKLLLKQILEKDAGLHPLPPSFVNGHMAVQRRRAKIIAAKLHIERIMHSNEICISEDLGTRK